MLLPSLDISSGKMQAHSENPDNNGSQIFDQSGAGFGRARVYSSRDPRPFPESLTANNPPADRKSDKPVFKPRGLMSSKRAVRRRECGGKKQYATMAEAVKACYQYQMDFGGWVRAYRCKFCHQFHIGHPNAKIKQSIRSQQERSG